MKVFYPWQSFGNHDMNDMHSTAWVQLLGLATYAYIEIIFAL